MSIRIQWNQKHVILAFSVGTLSNSISKRLLQERIFISYIACSSIPRLNMLFEMYVTNLQV